MAPFGAFRRHLIVPSNNQRPKGSKPAPPARPAAACSSDDRYVDHSRRSRCYWISECYDGAMRTVSALDVRRRFGEIVDQAAAGERIIIERAGQPLAALVPLADLELVDPERIKASRLAAIDRIERMAKRHPFTLHEPVEDLIRKMRLEREEQIARNIRGASS